jgi:hypothetical protein
MQPTNGSLLDGTIGQWIIAHLDQRNGLKMGDSMKLLKWILGTGVILLSLIWAPSAHAAGDMYCAGTVANLYVSSLGAAYVRPSWHTSWVRVCNVNQTTGGVSPTSCLTWISLLRNAVQRNAQTVLYYASGSNGPATCADMPTYDNALIPGYVMLNN